MNLVFIISAVLKLILFLLCSRESSATLNALSQDHRNDVFSNTIALLCGIIGEPAMFSVEIADDACLLQVTQLERIPQGYLRPWHWSIPSELSLSRSIS